MSNNNIYNITNISINNNPPKAIDQDSVQKVVVAELQKNALEEFKSNFFTYNRVPENVLKYLNEFYDNNVFCEDFEIEIMKDGVVRINIEKASKKMKEILEKMTQKKVICVDYELEIKDDGTAVSSMQMMALLYREEKLKEKKFQLGEKVWFMLGGLVAVEGRIISSYTVEEKYTIVVRSPDYDTFRLFEVTDKQIAKSKEELERMHNFNEWQG